MGAEVVLHGDSYNDAQTHCDTLAAESGMTFIHPFDDPLVIAGQGTIGDRDSCGNRQNELHAVFVPVGGGWFDCGHCRVSQGRSSRTSKVIGVEPFEAGRDVSSRCKRAPRHARSCRPLRGTRRPWRCGMLKLLAAATVRTAIPKRPT